MGVRQDVKAFKFAPNELRSNQTFVLAMLREREKLPVSLLPPKAWQPLEFVADEVKCNESFVMAAVMQDGHALRHFSADMQGNVSIVLAAVQVNGLALQYASRELQGSGAIVLAAVQQNGLAIRYASAELDITENMVLAAVKQNGDALRWVSCAWSDNEIVVLTAVQQRGLALQYADGRLQNSETMVLAAVQQNGLALEYASEELQDTDSIVSAAVQQNGLSLQFASYQLQGDMTIALEAVNQNSLALLFVNTELKQDSTIWLAALAHGRVGPIATKKLGAILREIGCFNPTEAELEDMIRGMAEDGNDALYMFLVSPQLGSVAGMFPWQLDLSIPESIVFEADNYSLSVPEYARARVNAQVLQVGSVVRTETAMDVTCTNLGGEEVCVSIVFGDDDINTTMLRVKLAQKLNVSPASVDIIMQDGELNKPDSHLSIL